jgi:hypothetical protein
MSFFYDLNKKLDSIRATPEVTHQQLNERNMSRAAKGIAKYTQPGMEELSRLGREGASEKKMDAARKKYDQYDNKEVEEGVMDTVKKVGKKVASGVNKLVGHGSDEDMIKDLQRKSGVPVTGKKPNFADKIANAKKEVDEMLGDVAAEAMRSALSPKQKKMAALGGNPKRIDGPDLAALRKGADMGEDDDNSPFTAHKRPRKDVPQVGSVERGAKHDIKHTATGRMVTRRTDDQGISVGADDDADTQAGPRGRGRPKGTKQSIGAKGPSGKSKLMTKESDVDVTDQGEYDQEGDMAKDDIKTIVRHAQALSKVLGDNDNLPEWVQSKLAKIEGMMISIDEYMQNQEDDEEEPIAEKAVSKQQQKFMGMAHAMQKGEKIKGASPELKKVAKTMKPKDTEDFAKTKHKGLPDKAKSKKKEEDVEESTTSGSVATSTATKGGGGIVGKGIYDSMNRELENMIAESMQQGSKEALAKQIYDLGMEIHTNDRMYAQDDPEGKAQLAKLKAQFAQQFPGEDAFKLGSAISHNEYQTRQQQNVAQAKQRPAGIMQKAKNALGGMFEDGMPGAGNKEALAKQIYDLGMSIHQNDRMYNQDDPEGKAQLVKLKAQFAQQFPGEDPHKLGSTISHNEYQTRQQQNVAQAKQRPASIMQKAKNALGGMYEGLNESMSVNMSDSTEGGKSLTITATDDDALKLASLLKNAGIGSQGSDMHSHGEEPCATCGMQDCGCGDVQEAVDDNAPDYPTNTETSNDALQYAGGLNKPKTDVAGDGQTTIPNTAVHTEEEDALRRMMEMAGLAEGNMPMVKKDGKMVPAFAADGKGKNDLETKNKDKEEDTVDESIQRMMEIAGVKKKPMDEQKTEEGNLFTKGLADDDIKVGEKIPGTNAIKKKDIDESIFALTNQWQAYKG